MSSTPFQHQNVNYHRKLRMGSSYFLLLLILFLPLLPMLLSLEEHGFISNSSNSNMGGCIELERKALLKFRECLSDPSGQLSSWVGENCCRWKGVGCSNRTGSVEKLDLRNNDTFMELESQSSNSWPLGGKISPSLLDLKYLNYLDLSMNNFEGIPIPNFLGSLHKLSYLNLSFSFFGGMVPPHLGNLSNLRYLDLYNFPLWNPQRNWVSDLNWLSGLSSLKYLDLTGVNLSLATNRWLQSVNMLPSLSQLHLAFCKLDNFPRSLPILNFTSLSVLNLENNYFNSEVPQWLFNISSLVDLNLANCSVKGLFPALTRGDSCIKFQQLDLTRNEISGDIGGLLRGLSRCSNKTLEGLTLSYNRLSGQLSDSFEHLKNLRSLLLDYNSISGPIPASIGRLSNLENLALSYNRMNGSIPESLGKLSELAFLHLYQNDWEGILSQNHFQGLTKLKLLFISSSSHKGFAFNVSHNWVPPFSLQLIGLDNCRLGPRFPTWLQTQTQLSTIFLTNAAISDKIPHWFWKLSPVIDLLVLSRNQIGGMLPISLEVSIGVVDLSFNRLEGPLPIWPSVSTLILANNFFSGSIPMNIGLVLPALEFLHLSGNSLSGSIPSSIGKMKDLNGLFLSNNHLSGKIHDQWGDLQELDTIDLSGNNLSGNIPGSMCSLPKLSRLKLSSNNLSEELSLSSLKNCTGLILLDLGYNGFTGNIPTWIGESLSSLSELSLRANTLSGNIPEQLCSLPKLHILDLAITNLSGFIPVCLGNLSGLSALTSYEPVPPNPLVTIQFLEMDLVVKGRETLFNLTLKLVNTIDLSSNNLRGKIPEEIANLLTLGTLNLSHNHLTGKIPEKIEALQQMETLDLSCNHLSGPIPPSMSSMTFLNHLNLSHNNFSGPIPSINQFLTFNDPSIYEGNPELCGDPLPTKCITLNVEDAGDQDHAKDENHDEENNETLWFYVSVGLGFLVGFWTVCGSLVIKESWRHSYFQFIDKVKDWLIMVIVLNVKRLLRMSERDSS